jgi:hypothetical protein
MKGLLPRILVGKFCFLTLSSSKFKRFLFHSIPTDEPSAIKKQLLALYHLTPQKYRHIVLKSQSILHSNT